MVYLLTHVNLRSADDNVDDGFNDTGLGLPRDLPPGIHLVLPKPPPPPASLTTPLGEENKGAQLLAKMGWRAGEGLGKDKSGIAEPVSVF
ncbi:unnamed protein product [Protopolystoma xenopodis]|uniref:G-patch domain-containing protein n=1 Tax=Protopolystoma xenopodis TaxID=117903 RepID=A0A448XH98_9PLAT|nr:unnamed protein product [Protopolystoma xenopodis]